MKALKALKSPNIGDELRTYILLTVFGVLLEGWIGVFWGVCFAALWLVILRYGGMFFMCLGAQGLTDPSSL